MNNAIGLNLQSTPSVDVGPAISNVQAISQSNNNGDSLKQGESGFFSILNTELEALVNIESTDAENLISLQALENVEGIDELVDMSKLGETGELVDIAQFGEAGELEELPELDMPNLVLSNNIIPLEEEIDESLALSEPKLILQDSVSELSKNLSEELGTELDGELNDELGVLLQQAILELPKNVTTLPLTPENKLFIQQQALALLEQKQPKLVEKLQQDGQWLPLQGTLLPLVDETLTLKENANEDMFKFAPAAPQSLSAKELSMMASSKDISLNPLEDLELTEDAELSFKNMFEKGESKTDASKDKLLLAESGIKNTVSDENSSRPKFMAEAVSTLSNNVLGANQATINTPTATAIQSGMTLQLPQNSSPEQWGNALGNKVQWMINTKMDSAEIRIDPPQLGKIDISIKMTDDGAQVVIQTQLAATRDLVDAASYRLKEMLEQAGHEQVDVDVSQKESNQSDSQFSQNDEPDNAQNSSKIESNLNQETVSSDVISRTFNSDRPVLDLFA